MARDTIPTSSLATITADRLAKTTPLYGIPEYQTIGFLNQTPASSASSLTTPFPVLAAEVVDALNVTTGWSASTGGAVSLNSTVGEFIWGTGCLNLRKTGTGNSVITYSKSTLTSSVFTAKDFWSWFFIDDLSLLAASGTVVSVRLGSSDANYYQKDFDITELSEGVNWLYFNIAGADSTTGSPSAGAITYFAIIITALSNATVWDTELRLDKLFLATSSDYIVSFETGPSLVGGGRTIRSSTRVRTSQGVGVPATNSGWFTSDGTMYGIDRFTRDDKTQNEEWQFTDEIQVVDK